MRAPRDEDGLEVTVVVVVDAVPVDTDAEDWPDPVEDVEDGVMALTQLVKYCTVTPSPLALIPVCSVPEPKPDHSWFDCVIEPL